MKTRSRVPPPLPLACPHPALRSRGHCLGPRARGRPRGGLWWPEVCGQDTRCDHWARAGLQAGRRRVETQGRKGPLGILWELSL